VDLYKKVKHVLCNLSAIEVKFDLEDQFRILASVDVVFEMLVTDNPSTDQIFKKSRLTMIPNILNKEIPTNTTYYRPYSLLNTLNDKLLKKLNQSMDNLDLAIDQPRKVYRAD